MDVHIVTLNLIHAQFVLKHLQDNRLLSCTCLIGTMWFEVNHQKHDRHVYHNCLSGVMIKPDFFHMRKQRRRSAVQ